MKSGQAPRPQTSKMKGVVAKAGTRTGYERDRNSKGLTKQGLLLLATVLGLNIAHGQMLALGFASLAFAAGGYLYVQYVFRLAKREGRTRLRPGRSVLGRVDWRPLRLTLLIFIVAILPLHIPIQITWPTKITMDTATEIATALATAFASIYISTYVDYYYVGPLMDEGKEEEFMLCKSSLDEAWGSLTKWWLLHRLGAILGFVLGLVAAVTLSALPIVSFNQVAAGAIAALTTILAGFYLARARDVIAFAIRPAFHVGDKIQLDGDKEDPEKLYFVVDVAMEGVRLLELEGPDDKVFDCSESPREHDRVLDFSEAAKMLRRRRRLKPCQQECKKVNAYCPRRAEAIASDLARTEPEAGTST